MLRLIGVASNLTSSLYTMLLLDYMVRRGRAADGKAKA